MAKRREKWAVWSDAEGLHRPPTPVKQLPEKAERSGNGRWATLWHPEKRSAQVVYCRIDLPEIGQSVRRRR